MKLTPATFVLSFLLVTVLLVAAACALHLVFDFSGLADMITQGEAEIRPHIVLDAGHGGRDGGASGPGGVCEKDLTFAVTEDLADFLRITGYDVALTRTQDVMMSDGGEGTRKMQDMRYRLQVARAAEDPVFVSIHMNRNPVESCRGTQIYYSGNHPDSRALANTMRETVVQEIQPENHRQVKEAGSSIYLLDRLECPAVLVECGFLSNPEEAEKLCDPAYQCDLAFVLCRAISSFSARQTPAA